MADGDELIKHLFQQSERIESLEQSNKVFKEKLQEVTGLPKYFGGREQIFEELEAQGMLGREEPGLQDDFDNAFRMFTEVNPKGQLIQGLQISGRPATLMELYQTMDLRGVIWNYGIGCLSALKGGWNSEISAAEKKSNDFIDELIKQRVSTAMASASPTTVLNYLDSADKLEHYIENREKIKQIRRNELYPVEKILKRKIYYGHRKDGKPKYITVEWKEGKELEPIFLEGELSPRKLQEIKQYSFTD